MCIKADLIAGLTHCLLMHVFSPFSAHLFPPNGKWSIPSMTLNFRSLTKSLTKKVLARRMYLGLHFPRHNITVNGHHMNRANMHIQDWTHSPLSTKINTFIEVKAGFSLKSLCISQVYEPLSVTSTGSKTMLACMVPVVSFLVAWGRYDKSQE